MTILLKVPLFRQSPSYCGPASMRMVLSYFGVDASEKKIAKIAGARIGIGTSAKGLVKSARRFGLSARVKDDSDISDIRGCLRKKIPVIVNWFSTDEGHYSVVTGLSRRHIFLNDPYKARKRKFKIAKFENCWFDFDSRKRLGKGSLIVRRIIIVEKRLA